MSTLVTVQGEAGVHRMLDDYMTPKLPRRMQLATKAGATVFKEPLKVAARPLSKRLARSVSVRVAKRDKPATIVTFRPKVAWFRHFIIRGTRDHGPRRANALMFVGRSGFIRTSRVRGVPAHPIVDRVADAHESQALRAIDQAMSKSEST